MDGTQSQEGKASLPQETMKPSYIESNAPQLLKPPSVKPRPEATIGSGSTARPKDKEASSKDSTSSPHLPPQTSQDFEDSTQDLQTEELSPDDSTISPDLYDLLEVPNGKPHAQQRSQPLSGARLNDAWWEDDSLNPQHISTTSSRPITTSSRGSNVSSIGTIPEFPIPGITPSPRNHHHSLPTSTRRGPSSHYSQPPDVAPIAEEPSGPNSHGSYASSMAVPIAIAEDSEDEENQEKGTSEPDKAIYPKAKSNYNSHLQRPPKSNVEQRSSEADIVPPLSLMTNAIKEKTSKESVRSDASRHGKKNVSPRKPLSPMVQDGRWQKQTSSPSSDLSQGSILLDPSSSSSSSESDQSQTRSPGAKSSDLRRPVNQRSPHTYHHPSPIPTQMETPYSPAVGRPPPAYGTYHPARASFGERVGNRRPPQLKVAAARGTEGRSSLTTLPDMIWRATKLAANLERGRTASTSGIDAHINPEHSKKISKSDSINDMLASFPPPALGTPTVDSRGMSPSRFGDSSGSGHVKEYNGSDRGLQRRCCGMPRWILMALLLTLVLVVAVVVVIVVVLVILPEQDKGESSVPAATGTACERQLICENGGSNVVTNGVCRCLCVNKFIGANCQILTDDACTTIDIQGIENVTVGGKIPEVLERSKSEFNVPLNASIIVNIFSKQNTSCTSQNALITFDGIPGNAVSAEFALDGNGESISNPDGNVNEGKEMQSVLGPALVPTAVTQVLEERAAQGNAVVVTNNGIVFEDRPTAAPDSSSGSEDDNSDVNASSNGEDSDVTPEEQKRLDFARLVILFILQTTSIVDAALTAQENFVEFFGETGLAPSSGANEGAGSSSSSLEDFEEEAKNVTLGSGISADLVDFVIAWPDGMIETDNTSVKPDPEPQPEPESEPEPQPEPQPEPEPEPEPDPEQQPEP